MGSLEDTTTRITMITFLSLIFLSLGSMGNAIKDRINIKSEIDSVNNEAKSLADNMNKLLGRIAEEDKEIFQNEDLYKELVDKIEDLALATEEENLIKLTETVKDRRIQEEISKLAYKPSVLDRQTRTSFFILSQQE